MVGQHSHNKYGRRTSFRGGVGAMKVLNRAKPEAGEALKSEKFPSAAVNKKGRLMWAPAQN